MKSVFFGIEFAVYSNTVHAHCRLIAALPINTLIPVMPIGVDRHSGNGRLAALNGSFGLALEPVSIPITEVRQPGFPYG